MSHLEEEHSRWRQSQSMPEQSEEWQGECETCKQGQSRQRSEVRGVMGCVIVGPLKAFGFYSDLPLEACEWRSDII